MQKLRILLVLSLCTGFMLTGSGCADDNLAKGALFGGGGAILGMALAGKFAKRGEKSTAQAVGGGMGLLAGLGAASLIGK